METHQPELNTMYLSTIPNIKRKFTNDKSPLDVSDIPGTRSRYIEHPRPQRDCPWRSNSIEKSQPKQLIPQVVNKPSFLLEIDDIEGTRTKINKFTTNRHTNPLQPQYQAPKVEFVPFPEPKFIRDNMAIDDIEGVRSRETFASKIQKAGKIIDIKTEITADIKPTQKGFKRRNNNFQYNLRANDINKGENVYMNLTKRHTNPLEPTYNVPGLTNYGSIEGSKRVVKNNGLPLRQNNSLLTGDIEGAKPKINNFVVEKKEEVIGSKPETLKRGISTNRKTNPLQPNYNYPGCSQSSQTKTYTRPKTAVQRFDAFLK